MYTRKQQMAKVEQLDVKVDAIAANIEQTVESYLAKNLAQVVHFNHSVLEVMTEVLTDSQQEKFFELLSVKMDEFTQ